MASRDPGPPAGSPAPSPPSDRTDIDELVGAIDDEFPWRPAPRPAVVSAPDEADGRPWSPRLAMEALPPLAPPLPPDEDHDERSRLMTVVVACALLVAVVVVAASRLHLGTTAAPGFALNGLTALPDTAATAALAPGHYPAGVREVNVAADYVGAHPGDLVEFHVTADSAPGALPLPQPTRTFTAADPSTGEVRVTVSPGGGGGFVPGTYTITALRNGTPLLSARFTVDPPAPPAPAP